MLETILESIGESITNLRWNTDVHGGFDEGGLSRMDGECGAANCDVSTEFRERSQKNKSLPDNCKQKKIVNVS